MPTVFCPVTVDKSWINFGSAAYTLMGDPLGQNQMRFCREFWRKMMFFYAGQAALTLLSHQKRQSHTPQPN